MNASDLLETALLHNGMTVGKNDTLRMADGSVLSYLRESRPRKKKGKGKLLFLSLLMIITLCLSANRFASGSQVWIYRQMDKMLLIPREEPFTALYFEYYEDLPTAFEADEVVSFTFTIKNSEGYDKEYIYDAYFKDGIHQGSLSVDKGKVFIKNGESRTISESYVFAQKYKQETLFVELPESGQKIHFILKNNQ